MVLPQDFMEHILHRLPVKEEDKERLLRHALTFAAVCVTGRLCHRQFIHNILYNSLYIILIIIIIIIHHVGSLKMANVFSCCWW